MSSRTVAFVTSMIVLSAGCAERAGDGQPATGAPLIDPDRELWVERNGRLICNGYLSRSESDRFCSRERPPDWQSFEYAGETYFVQPLAGLPRRRESPRRSTVGR